MARTSGFVDSPWVQVLDPAVFIVVAFVIGMPQLLLHVLRHPFLYIFSSASVSDRVSALRSKLFFYAWRVISPRMDSGHRPNKAPLLSKAYGTTVEIGPGVGDNIKYYGSQVSRLILVEPNINMHPALRTKANESGFFEHDDTLLLLGCGGAASDEEALASAGVGPASVDSIMSILVLCGIPKPAEAIEMYRRMLKPGGLLAFYEHVRSDKPFTANWQAWYTRMIWPKAFDGCCLDRPTGAWIMAGPNAASGRDLITGKELAHSVNGVNELVHERWSDYQIASPKDQRSHSMTPHVMGYAVKA